jgi:hypothetical protein
MATRNRAEFLGWIILNQAEITQKKRNAAANPQTETSSHHLLERMLAITGQTMLVSNAISNKVDASLYGTMLISLG